MVAGAGVVTGDSSDVPREVLVPALPPDAEELTQWLCTLRGTNVVLRVPQRGDKKALYETVERNAKHAFALHKTKRASDLTARSMALAEIQEALGLDEAPLRIECFDVSNLQGTSVVASMVVFEDGLARKSEYRRFAVKDVEGQDDVASIHEVIRRRFARYVSERLEEGELDAAEHGPHSPLDPETGRPRKFAYPPQLVVVDGGPPQVAAAQRALDDLGISDVSLCGLAKRLEEVWLPGEDVPVILPRTSEGLYLLQRVRDEAHRFAITYHRQKRSKSMVESALDDIAGLGATRKKALLRHFGSLKRLRAASVDEVMEVPGVGRRTAETVVAALSGEPAAAPAFDPMTGEVVS
jgi:excinuclease ABC subunit C